MPSPKLQQFYKTDKGATLVEELVTVAIIGMGIVILIAMITTGALGVKGLNDSVRADGLARSQLEIIKDAPYQSNPVASPYPSVSPLAGYNVTVGIDYWNAASGTFQSSPHDDGLQRITVTVSSGATEITKLATYKVDR